ncbi:MAG: sugar phosphate isomerase/epimerase [Planctomycetaceae bacterium]|nr:sugar phosphate isomerase/epimerase [Planctomycetaceae bacterium]
MRPLELSCFPNSYGPFGPLAALRHLPTLGVTHLELPIKNAGVPSFFKETPLLTDASTPEEVDAVRDLIAESGMQLSSCNISSGNPLEEVPFERTLRKLDLVQQLGVSLIVSGGGEAPAPDDYARLIDQLKQLGDAAAERGIVYCCETHPGTCQNAESMLQLMESVAHPHIRINFDTGNILYYNSGLDVLEELRLVLPYVRHVHLKDTNGGYKQWHFPALGVGGAIDFVAVKNILQEASYTGPCSLELEGIEGEPELTREQYEERMRQSIEFLRRRCEWPC